METKASKKRSYGISANKQSDLLFQTTFKLVLVSKENLQGMQLGLLHKHDLFSQKKKN